MNKFVFQNQNTLCAAIDFEEEPIAAGIKMTKMKNVQTQEYKCLGLGNKQVSTKIGSGHKVREIYDNDSENERDSDDDMKITTAKPMAGFKRKEGDPNMKGKHGGRQKQRVTVLNQTNGGMQPWHSASLRKS